MRKTVIHHLPLTRDPASPKQLFDASCFDSEHSLWRETTLIARGTDDLRFYYLASESSLLRPFVNEYRSDLWTRAQTRVRFFPWVSTNVRNHHEWERSLFLARKLPRNRKSFGSCNSKCLRFRHVCPSQINPFPQEYSAFSRFAARRHRLTSHFLNTFISIFAP